MSNRLPVLSSPPWSPRTKRLVALIGFGIVLYLVFQLGTAWVPVLIAVLLSYLLFPLVNRIEETLRYVPGQPLRRTLAVLLTFGVVVAGVTLFVLAIVPPLSNQVEEFVNNAPELISETRENTENQLRKPITLGNTKVVPWQLIEGLFGNNGQDPGPNDQVSSLLQGAITALIDPAAGLVGGVVNVLFSALFTLAMMFYLMKDGGKFVQAMEDFTPLSYRGDVRFLLFELGAIWNAYFRGQLVLCLMIGSATYAGASVLGLPQPLVLGLLAGLLEFIPNIGPTLSAIPAVLIALVVESATIPGLRGPFYALVVVGMYLLIQNLESVFLVPRVMGRSLNLHPFVVLVAVVFGAKIAGLMGVILAAPVTATLRLFAAYLWSKLADVDQFGAPARQPSGAVPAPGPALAPAIPAVLAWPEDAEEASEVSEGEIVQE